MVVAVAAVSAKVAVEHRRTFERAVTPTAQERKDPSHTALAGWPVLSFAILIRG